MDLNANLPRGSKWIISILFKSNLSFLLHFSIISIIIFIFLSFFWFQIFSSWFFSSFDIRFLNRLIPWCTHSMDFLELVPVNQIHHLLLHIFHRLIWVLMKVISYFLWPVCIYTGALRLVMRSVFLISLIYSVIFSIYLELIIIHIIKSKQN